jgi:gentisate 1,2-dioxygenase
MSIRTTAAAPALDQWIKSLDKAALDAPWTQPGPLIRPKKSAMQAKVWRWREIEPLLRRSPEFMQPGRGAERRILRLDNPGVPERTTAHTISVAVQYLLPGEVVPAHRHTPNAIRFMLHGEGAFTTIEGDKFVMRRGDLVVTPSMTWHDHGNDGSAPVIWTDGLDSPVVRYLENLFGEEFEGDAQPVRTGPALPERAAASWPRPARACGCPPRELNASRRDIFCWATFFAAWWKALTSRDVNRRQPPRHDGPPSPR